MRRAGNTWQLGYYPCAIDPSAWQKVRTSTSTRPSFLSPQLFWHGARFKRRYDLVYVHNMPDILVASALVPKLLGAKVILDQHDPMPELMMTIFGLDQGQFRRAAC